ncbi:ArsR family transcriptional regulator [Natronospirillum operosum]|uniref:ArsR family transcriptional regulator n=1 Tax=Natronospirillum operosum TaxID=2759953 RepID=A0A4Z0W6H4_9GAMM|nr:winged helix-turn-helix domain-containing protein [Natronospirillum operosum]TGG92825.1 ArsR family transcriptional regulator [Natronospirillum operosum]
MSEGPNIVRIAALIGDNARAEALSALMSGRALTATELADAASVTRQTMSSHLQKLLEAGLLKVSQQGRHRYFRLAGADVAYLIESMMGVAFHTTTQHPRTGPRDPALRKARICYDHLAGEMGVYVYQQMLEYGLLLQKDGALSITDQGREWFRQLGIDADEVAQSRRSFCRACLDWSERKDHLAGALGAALLSRILELGWARRVEDSRAIEFSAQGEASLRGLMRLRCTE